jgi:large subunit ribosomal protein L28
MSRRCSVTGKGVLVGNHVSHANNRTKRRFLPNLQRTALMSEALGKPVRLRISTRGIRTVEHNGGLDTFLLKTPDAELSPEVRRIKRLIEKKVAAAQPAAR